MMSSLLPMPLAQSATANSRCSRVIDSPFTRSTVGLIQDSPGPSLSGSVNHSHCRLCT